jgi:glyoxylase-like metal-dependent hydrolase (beta-lactamase superfamily II)
MGAALVAARHWHTTEPTAPRPDGVPVLAPAALTVAPGIHLLGELAPAAAYAVETPEGLVLVDSGTDPDAGPLRGQLAALGLDVRHLKAILLTHAHADHSGGAEALRRATGAKVYAGEGDAAVLRAGGPREAFFSTFRMPGATAHPTAVDVALRGDEVLDFGGVRFRALAAPGHTPGSVCYLMERDGRRVLFSGDVLMCLAGDGSPRAPLGRPLGTYSAYLAPRYRGDARAFLRSLRTLRELPVPDLVLPGHPRLDPVPQSPRLTQARWEALLDDGVREMEALVARYERDGEPFLDGTPQKLLPDLYYLGDRDGAAVHAFSASSKWFLVDAPGGPGLGDFVTARLRQLGAKPAAPAAVLLTSGGPEATSGLPGLVARGGVRVVAAPAGLRAVRDLCPPGTAVLSADDLPKAGWFDVTVLPLGGRGRAAVAYRLRWAGKDVLFSGRIPVGKDWTAAEALRDDLAAGRADRSAYATALDRLGRLSPDLWLPAVPSDGQNARLYAGDWEETLAENRKLLDEAPRASP